MAKNILPVFTSWSWSYSN